MAKDNILTENLPDDDDPFINEISNTPDDPALLVDGPMQGATATRDALAEVMRTDPARAAELVMSLLALGGARTAAPAVAPNSGTGWMDKNGNPLDWDAVPPGTVAYSNSLNVYPSRMLWPEKKAYSREYQEETADGFETIINRDPLLTFVGWNGVPYHLPVGQRVKVPAGVAAIYNNALDEQVAFANCETLHWPAHLDMLRNNGKGGSLRLGASGGFDQYEVYHTVKSAGGFVPPEIERILRRRPATEVPDTNSRPGVM